MISKHCVLLSASMYLVFRSIRGLRPPPLPVVTAAAPTTTTRTAFQTRGVSLHGRQAIRSADSKTTLPGASVPRDEKLFQQVQSTNQLHIPFVGKNRKSFRHARFMTTDSSSSSTETTKEHSTSTTEDFFHHQDFASLGITSAVLLDRIRALGFTNPTTVQAAAYAKIASSRGDVTIGAETGSGKTLAYLLPIMNAILEDKRQQPDAADGGHMYARALILVPNKELIQQVLRMATPLAGGEAAIVFGKYDLPMTANTHKATIAPKTQKHDMVRIAVMPGGLKEVSEFLPFRKALSMGSDREPPVDIIISTPAAVGPLGLSPKNIDMFTDIDTVIIDEADMLLDGGYIRQLENVLMGFRRADRSASDPNYLPTQHVFVAATIPDYGLRSVDSYLRKKFPRAERMTMMGMHKARHSGLTRKTSWIQLESKRERMERIVKLLETPAVDGGLQGEKVMIFLNTVDDVDGALEALQSMNIAAVPYHAKVSLEERALALERFRRYNSDDQTKDAVSEGEEPVPILVCTDLASRGLDIPGVNTVVQLQFATNVVAHLHRMGRCGRAGQRDGRGIVFYGETESALVDVVKKAEEQQERMTLEGDVLDLDSNENEDAGTVNKGFSRKRGFTKKRKKARNAESRDEPDALE